MSSIREIIQKGKGTAGNWRVEREIRDEFTVCHLYHYSTKMLSWRDDYPIDEDVLDYSIGWGSVSDQNGMNQAFRILGIPLYFSRKGGPEIVPTDSTVLPKYIRDNPEIFNVKI